MGAGRAVGIRLLGRFDVTVDGTPVPDDCWSRRATASLVKLLALSDRRRLHREQVVDALWPDTTIDRALPRLHKAAHFVRRATGAQDAVVLADQVVVLFPDADVVVDVAEFERLAGTDPEAALAVYGGDLLPDDPYEPWTEQPRQRLRLRHRDVLRRTEHWLDLVTIDPTDEAAHVGVMRGLLAAGDRAGARRQFEMLRQVLRQELDAEPGPEAAALYQRSLESPIVLAVPVDTRPSPLPPVLELLADDTTFVGRTSERARLRQQWELARAGHTLFALVTGEPGIGKSRIVAELATEVHTDGGRVLLGSCHEDVDEPYEPFLEAMAVEPRPPATATAPGDVIDGIVDWLVARASAAPVLLVVEDVHWSTSTTRDALRHLVRRAGRAPLLVVATTRDSRPDVDDDLAALLAELERAPSVRRIALAGLDRDEVAQLAGSRTDDPDLVLHETRGNPLLVTHLLDDVRSGTLPIWLYQRDQRLTDEARAVLDQAATFGTEFDADLLAAACRVPLVVVLEHLEAAEAAGLVTTHPGRRTDFTFVHALFRSARYRGLSARARLELHAQAATALATRAGDDGHLAERARHACLAVPLIDATTAADLARAAGRHHERAHAYAEAVAQYRRGLEASRLLDPPDPAVVLALEVAIAAALHHAGDRTGLPQLLDGAKRALARGDTATLIEAATAIPQFGAVGFVDPMTEGRVITEAALAALGDEPSAPRARLLMDLASHWLFVDVDDALDVAGRAEAVARQLDDPELLGSVLLAARHLFSQPGRIDDRIRIGAELELLGRRLDRLPFTLAGVATLATTHLERGQLTAWSQRFERFVELLGDRSLGFFQIQAIVFEAHRAYLAGDLARAEDIARRTVPWSVGIGAGRVHAESMVVANRRLQARDDEVVARYERGASRSTDAWYRCSLAAAQARSGRLADATRTLRSLRAERFPIRRIYPWSVAVSDLAEAAEVVGDGAAAAHVLHVAAAYSGRIGVSGPHPNRPYDQVLAQAALAAGDPARAVSYAERAVAASRHRQTPGFLARELVFLAEAHRRTGAPDGTVRPLVAEALTVGDALGARIVAVDVERYGLPS